MKAISYLGKIEKLLSVPATNRNWNTILKLVKVLHGHVSFINLEQLPFVGML
jgi:hypothetical protein